MPSSADASRLEHARVVRPGVVCLRLARSSLGALDHEARARADGGVMVAGRELPTQRPKIPSTSEAETDELDPFVRLGLVMAGQTRIEAAQADLGRRFDSIESAWRSVRTEHETTQSQVTHLQKSVEDLLHEQKATQKMIRRLGKLGPAALGLIEVARWVIEHAQQIPHH
jgi:hypothetical protein